MEDLPVLSYEQGSLKQFLISMVPSNILAAFSRGEMVGLILFSLLFGYALSKIEKPIAHTVFSFFSGIFQIMIQMTRLIIKCLPFGVFCLVSKAFMTSGAH